MFFDRYAQGERSLLVHPEGLEETEREDLHEFCELARSSGVEVIDTVSINIKKISPRYFISRGKVEEIADQIRLMNIELVLFNHTLSPGQEKNLEAEFKCRVVDRTGLILDIFAQRARTHEGKLQVELAQLEHISTRLIRGWTHLERQKGGVGLRGPGETQLETDRRLLRARIRSIDKRLEKVRKQREQTRRSRVRAEIPQVSIVGYTNAGKSTLFNRMTASEVLAENRLFATLDPTLRKLEIQDVGPVILADTVGFIRHLPHRLVEAFRATLEESVSADLLVHVVDCASDERDDNIQQVYSVLQEIGAGDIPQLLVFNKIDLQDDLKPRIDRDEQESPIRVWVSAMTGEGVGLLEKAIMERLANRVINRTITLDSTQGRLRSRLYSMGAVCSESVNDDGSYTLKIRIPEARLDTLMKKELSG